jgi:hypothetical protein
MQMKNADWPKSEIKRIAGSSGKPLEVTCAEAFLAAGWKARLGSHFSDGARDVVRELDVLAEKEDLTSTPIRMRVLLSCRGFSPERSPLVYSVSESSVPKITPRLLSSHRFQGPVGQSYGSLDEVEAHAAAHLLKVSGLSNSRQIVAFDIIERSETPPKDPKKGNTIVEYKRVRDGDRNLFSAIDNAVKAAFFWMQEDYQPPRSPLFAALNVPACALSPPFWDVCIDGGKLAAPQIQYHGYQSNSYPTFQSNPSYKDLMALIWSAEQITDLVVALEELFKWFVGKINSIIRKA